MRAVARAQDARLGRWLGRVGWYCPGVLSFVPPIRHRHDSDAIAATRTPSPRLGRHRCDSDAISATARRNTSSSGSGSRSRGGSRVLPRRLVVATASFLADPAAEPVGVIGAHGPSFTPPIRHRRDGRAHRGRGRLALIELLNGGALAASLAALAVEEEPQLKPAEHAVAHYGAGALFADPRFRGGVLARLRVASMASTARRLSLRSTAEASLERAAAPRLDAAAALPQATTTAGAPSARARRWRRSRPPASSSGSGTRARPSSGSTPSLRRPRLLLS